MVKIKDSYVKIMEVSLVLVGALLLFLLFSFFISSVSGGLGEPNATVVTHLTVGETYPDILNVSVNDDDETITLAANDTVLVSCIGLIRDYNGETNLSLVTARFFHSSSSYDGGIDNNTHYRNGSCNYTETTGDWGGVSDDEYHALANCSFDVQYYALPGVWNCTMWVNDSTDFNGSNSDDINVSELLALEVPGTINYGLVNATDMSNENITNVSNVGNVIFNLSFSGYGYQEGDNLAMNCTLGNIKNISVEHEKYNLTEPNPGALAFAAADAVYKNLSTSAIVNLFDLDYRTDEDVQDAINESYWRIYVPTGVAGTCQGNIVFGAVQSDASP